MAQAPIHDILPMWWIDQTGKPEATAAVLIVSCIDGDEHVIKFVTDTDAPPWTHAGMVAAVADELASWSASIVEQTDASEDDDEDDG